MVGVPRFSLPSLPSESIVSFSKKGAENIYAEEPPPPSQKFSSLIPPCDLYFIFRRERLALLKAPVTSNRSYSPVVSSDAHSAKSVPVELQCPMCKKLLHDAVLIPCCGTSYCDECKYLFVDQLYQKYVVFSRLRWRVYETTTATATTMQCSFCFRTSDSKDSLFSVRICFP